MLALAALALLAATDPVFLGTAADFAILTKTGISTVPSSSIHGNIGVSPIAATAMTGFSLIKDTATGQFSMSTQVTGQAFGPTYAQPTPMKLTTAVGDLMLAYTDAAGRAVSSSANLNIGAGSVTGESFGTGVYKWDTDVNFNTEIFINGTSSDVFIFQMAGSLTVAASTMVTLVDNDGSGGPRPSNIVWQVAGSVTVGAGSHLEGIILVKNDAAFGTASSLNGRILAQTAATLNKAIIVAPPPPSPPSPPPSPAPPPGGIEVKPSNNILDTATGVDATTAIIIGVVVGLGGGLILIGALTYAYYKYRKGPRFSPKTKTEVHELEVGPR